MTRRRDLASQDLFLDLVRAHEQLMGEFQELFKAHGLTMAWFNVLRILLGGPAEGLPCQAVAERLVQRVPDVTRLLDRMEKAGLVTRQRSASDRRVVLVTPTDEGRSRCDALADPVLALHARQLEHLSLDELGSLHVGLRSLLEA